MDRFQVNCADPCPVDLPRGPIKRVSTLAGKMLLAGHFLRLVYGQRIPQVRGFIAIYSFRGERRNTIIMITEQGRDSQQQ